MDLFDERILAVLKDRKPRAFTQLLKEVGSSHNTLRPILSENKECTREKFCSAQKKEPQRPNKRALL
jgi:hypothetical protein